VASWAPVIYRVPETEHVTELCLCLLRHERGGAFSDFDEQVRSEFALKPVSDEEFGGPAAG